MTDYPLLIKLSDGGSAELTFISIPERAAYFTKLMREPKNPHIVSVEILPPRVRPTVETLFFGPKDDAGTPNEPDEQH